MRAFLIVLNVLILVALGLAAILFVRGVHIDENVVFLPVQRPDRVELAIRGEGTLGDHVQHKRALLGNETIAITTVGPDVGPLIVSCFGNASDRYAHGVDYANKIAPFGQVLVWDYPGYGDSSGAAGVVAIEDVADEFVALVEDRAAGRPIIYWGHSLGGFVCSNLAGRATQVDAVILETTAQSIRSVAKAWTPMGIPIRVTFNEDLLRFDIPDALANLDRPILIIGAGRDRVLPVELARELAEAMPQATYLELPQATHFSAGFDPKAQAAVAKLLARP
ncbi:hypothetical protein GCM10007853_26900 [Algimonas ampicilliniresistens]|uniref:Serine aminopeptidase S33 domain-containing protein n=1 Tax=Algimonas ampicilliniresistens TaxID=1298735 RepID=A0ABQ5VE11_9PROT|nr:alpha/beta fold hydrolase [Algimonas ampicilliniresistens]GLQ24816.1 hypothetical protein GCM10007853_26900 [Algimonas ampicilliniresistens]